MNDIRKFSGYVANSDEVYLNGEVWTENRQWLLEKGAKLLTVKQANRLPIANAIRISERPLGKGHYLYRAIPDQSFQTILMPYEPDDQQETAPKNMHETYAEIILSYVEENFSNSKFLCSLDPNKCCAVQINDFDYDLLYSVETLNMVTPFVLADESFTKIVIFNFDLPIQQISAKSLTQIAGKSSKEWNDEYFDYWQSLKASRGEDDHLVNVLKYYLENDLK